MSQRGGGLGSTETRAMRRAAMRLGLQTAVAVAVVVIALIAVALTVVLHSQQSAAVDLIEKTVAAADDVTDPPAGSWLYIASATKTLRTAGLPAAFPDRRALLAATADLARSGGVTGPPHTTTETVGGREYLVSTQARPSAIVQGVLDLSGDHADRDRLVAALLLSGTLGLGLAALAGAFLASRALKPLASSLALQRRFVADASHELRTPLTLLSTRAQLIQRGLRRHQSPAALAADIDGLVADADQLAMILEDLLVAADPRGQDAAESVDIGLLADQVAAACGPAAREVDVEVDVEVAIELGTGPVMVQGASVALRRALTALVDNAVRHARREVLVSVAVRGGRVIVEIADDGPGIDAEILPRLFERFESSGADGPAHSQADSGQRRYGLGLALVSEVVARHGGTVSARNGSRVGSGSGSGLGSGLGSGAGGSGAGATLELSLPQAT